MIISSVMIIWLRFFLQHLLHDVYLCNEKFYRSFCLIINSVFYFIINCAFFYNYIAVLEETILFKLDEHEICRGIISRFLLRVTHSYLVDMRRKSLLITLTTSISWVDLTNRSSFVAILLAQHSVLVSNLFNNEKSMYCDLFNHINRTVLVNYLWFWRELVKLGELL